MTIFRFQKHKLVVMTATLCRFHAASCFHLKFKQLTSYIHNQVVAKSFVCQKCFRTSCDEVCGGQENSCPPFLVLG